MSNSQKKILVVCDYYLPSVGAGGGVRILANIVSVFADKYKFYVVARDHDSKADRTPFKQVSLNEWTTYNGISAYYFSEGMLPEQKIEQFIEEIRPDIIVSNGIYGYAPRKFLWMRRLPHISKIPLIIIPCGELLTAALNSKRLKKETYIRTLRLFRRFKDAVWSASSEEEKQSVLRHISADADVLVAPFLTPVELGAELRGTPKPEKRAGSATFSFVGRIIDHKNILYFLKLLQNQTGSIHLNIIGPKEDPVYWAKCEAQIASLPPNITVHATDLIQPDEVMECLKNSDYMVLPSRSENFGYVIIEAWAVGTPVLITDGTAWDLTNTDAGYAVPLDDSEKWGRIISEIVELNNEEYLKRSNAALNYAENWLTTQPGVEGMKKVFDRALSKSHS